MASRLNMQVSKPISRRFASIVLKDLVYAPSWKPQQRLAYSPVLASPSTSRRLFAS